MAYQFLVASSISDLVNAIGIFAVNNGWSLAVQDTKTPQLPAVAGNTVAINPRSLTTPNDLALLSIQRAGTLGRASHNDAAPTTGIRLVLKEPNGAYFHLFGLEGFTAYVDGRQTPDLCFLELWISDGYNGATAEIYDHPGLAKLGTGGPYRPAFEGCHLFTGLNVYNNKRYFNVVMETIPSSFEHFGFGYIETYFDMQYGEFWQASGQSGAGATYGTYQSSADVLNTVVTNNWGVLGAMAPGAFDVLWDDVAIAVGGTGSRTNPNNISSALIRYAMPGWQRDRAFLCGTTFNSIPSNIASVGAKNEFVIPLFQFAGLPTAMLTPNPYSGVSVFTPAYIGALSPLENNYWGLLGHYPNQRICNIANNNPKDVVAFGQDEWMLFPLHRKGVAVYDGAWPVVSGNYGVAYKR